MKIPRDISGVELTRRLDRLGYSVTRQTGSHIRLTTDERGEHHVTIPEHDPLKVGTFAAILREIGRHHDLDRDALLKILFGRNS